MRRRRSLVRVLAEAKETGKMAQLVRVHDEDKKVSAFDPSNRWDEASKETTSNGMALLLDNQNWFWPPVKLLGVSHDPVFSLEEFPMLQTEAGRGKDGEGPQESGREDKSRWRRRPNEGQRVAQLY
ncbi:unnamed protein product [Caenorhabditis auriculariae]|uniref:Uncharacterized protein n=1 Tax=Caenorhabditis auriculariae TaxID=2777116 RepID=A0A8S1HI32_9PELO|nr:unnamed protein product [Caenorhabditis auriculariae]